MQLITDDRTYRAVQEQLFSYSFDLTSEQSSDRAARVVLEVVQSAKLMGRPPRTTLIRPLPATLCPHIRDPISSLTGAEAG